MTTRGGGRQSLGIPLRSQPDLGIVYQPAVNFLQTRRAEFKALIQEVARSHRHLCGSLQEAQTCDAIIRGSSLSFNGMELLCTLVARSNDNPMRLGQTIDGAVLLRRLNPTPICIFEASELENEANHPLNAAQLLFAREKTAVRAVQVIEAAQQQEFATRRLIDAATLHVETLA